MALSGLEIYKLLPKTNCKKCGFPTCLAFAMQLAAKKVSLDKCPDVTEDAKRALESAAQPPIKLITIGKGDEKLEIGNETVLFRHEEKFYHPTGIGFLLEDTSSEQDLRKALEEIKKLDFERVGQRIKANIIALSCKSKDASKFEAALKVILQGTNLPVALMSDEPPIMEKALEISKDKNPLIYRATSANFKEMAKLSKAFKAPLVASAPTLEELEGLVKNLNAEGVQDIVLDTGEKGIAEKLWDFTQIRRLALKKAFRPFGYPVIAFTKSEEPFQETAEASTYVAKYAGIVVLKNRNPWSTLPILTLRQNIYTDPQKPLQVEAKIYEIGKVSDKSPVLVTTNFSLTYYTVEAEVESSKVPSYIVSCDSEGMSVLTAWAAEKFTAETITKTLKRLGVKDKVSHKEVVIPGYVAVLSGKLEEESGWKVTVGPREASGIPSFLKNLGK
ncbi:MAG: acetyl-CoA decarbonylase/synthase complex subunit gamma [Candidatus Omnitrophota bacterium]|nr:MAG: acetyl-CoA decarbonylase/synthase complex subunit gamma [Candidatus Omnitrophota bacterium]